MPRARRSFASSMPCIIGIVQATTKRGPTLRRFNEPRGSTRPSNTAHGVANSVPNSCRPGEVVAQEHWCSSGFANTDLDLQLKKHGIHQLIVIGLIAHTCIEATVRYAAELGYEVT